MYVERHSIVYLNRATHNPIVAVLYVIATCGSLFFSQVRTMVLFGIANLVILIVTGIIKEYAFTSVCCAYAALASAMIWVGFRHSGFDREREHQPAV